MRRTRLKISKTKVRRDDSWDRYYCVTVPKLGGGRRRRFFAHTPEGKREAETFFQIAKTQQENDGVAALSHPEEVRNEAGECQRLLQTVSATLTEAGSLFSMN